MLKINLEPVGKFMKQVGEAALYIAGIAAAWKFSEFMAEIPDNKPVGYDDAVGAIMDSSMFSHDKANAVAALKRYAGAEFYQAVIYIVNDPSTFSHDKAVMIEQLSEN